MATITILGCAYAIPNTTHEVTHFVVQGNETGILVDCGSNPTVRLEQANISYDSITDLILTHFHPDHISGAPLMLMNMWLLGRKKSLRIHGLAHCLDNLMKLMQAYEWDQWPDFFPVEFHEIPETEKASLLINDEFSIKSSPGNHMVIGYQLLVLILCGEATRFFGFGVVSRSLPETKQSRVVFTSHRIIATSGGSSGRPE